jgi:hypothetical protein
MKYLIMVIIAFYAALFIDAAISATEPTVPTPKVCSYISILGNCVYIQA